MLYPQKKKTIKKKSETNNMDATGTTAKSVPLRQTFNTRRTYYTYRPLLISHRTAGLLRLLLGIWILAELTNRTVFDTLAWYIDVDTDADVVTMDTADQDMNDNAMGVDGSPQLPAFFSSFQSNLQSPPPPIIPPTLQRHRSPFHRLWFYRGSYAFQAGMFSFHIFITFLWTFGIGCCNTIHATAEKQQQSSIGRSFLYPLHRLFKLICQPHRYLTFLVWALYTALHGRNEYISDGSDMTCRHLLFWLMLLPTSPVAGLYFSSGRKEEEKGSLLFTCFTWRHLCSTFRSSLVRSPTRNSNRSNGDVDSSQVIVTKADAGSLCLPPLSVLVPSIGLYLQLMCIYLTMVGLRVWVPDLTGWAKGGSAVYYATRQGFRTRQLAKDMVDAVIQLGLSSPTSMGSTILSFLFPESFSAASSTSNITAVGESIALEHGYTLLQYMTWAGVFTESLGAIMVGLGTVCHITSLSCLHMLLKSSGTTDEASKNNNKCLSSPTTLTIYHIDTGDDGRLNRHTTAAVLVLGLRKGEKSNFTIFKKRLLFTAMKLFDVLSLGFRLHGARILNLFVQIPLLLMFRFVRFQSVSIIYGIGVMPFWSEWNIKFSGREGKAILSEITRNNGVPECSQRIYICDDDDQNEDDVVDEADDDNGSVKRAANKSSKTSTTASDVSVEQKEKEKVWRCDRCQKIKPLSGPHLEAKTKVRSDCWPCGIKRTFDLVEKQEEEKETETSVEAVKLSPNSESAKRNKSYVSAFVSGFFIVYMLYICGCRATYNQPIDGGDVGEAIRFDNLWIMFTRPPKRGVLWSMRGHIKLEGGGGNGAVQEEEIARGQGQQEITVSVDLMKSLRREHTGDLFQKLPEKWLTTLSSLFSVNNSSRVAKESQEDVGPLFHVTSKRKEEGEHQLSLPQSIYRSPEFLGLESFKGKDTKKHRRTTYIFPTFHWEKWLTDFTNYPNLRNKETYEYRFGTYLPAYLCRQLRHEERRHLAFSTSSYTSSNKNTSFNLFDTFLRDHAHAVELKDNKEHAHAQYRAVFSREVEIEYFEYQISPWPLPLSRNKGYGDIPLSRLKEPIEQWHQPPQRQWRKRIKC